jgi:hypothetical protein
MTTEAPFMKPRFSAAIALLADAWGSSTPIRKIRIPVFGRRIRFAP